MLPGTISAERPAPSRFGIRDGSTTIYLEPFAELGNLIFGTGLLAAAVVAVLDSTWRDRPIS